MFRKLMFWRKRDEAIARKERELLEELRKLRRKEAALHRWERVGEWIAWFCIVGFMALLVVYLFWWR